MRKFIGIIALASMPFLATAQYTHDFAGCPASETVLKDNPTPPFFGSSSDDLQNYFSEKLLPILENQDPSGDLILTLVIEQDGTPCLSGFTLEGEVRIEPNHIKNIVDGMQGWQAARREDESLTYTAKINLRFKGNKVVARLAK
ncbi:MAG: hypothetical protein IPJ00_01090 [Saprospirales bacterium]|nr:hypothetical protein [Saprospirales bacterium]